MPSYRGNQVAVNGMKKDGVIAALSRLESKATVHRNYIIIAPSMLGLLHSLKQ
jgi:hypothetical protein